MPWLKFKLRADQQRAEVAAAALETCGAVSVSFEDAGEQAIFALAAEENTPLWAHTGVMGLFPADADPDIIFACCQQYSPELAGLAHDSEIIADQDWERTWLTEFKPLHFGQELWVCPSWCPPPDPGATNVILDPGLAFGTGTHATTALCLEWLAREGRNMVNQTVIDYGCGSGILAIAALKLGACKAWGVDIDARALVTSGENASVNGVLEQLALVLPDALPVTLQADIVIANILAGPLTQLAPLLTSLVKINGRLLLSGLLTEQVAEVCQAYRPSFNFAVRVRAEWALLVGSKLFVA